MAHRAMPSPGLPRRLRSPVTKHAPRGRRVEAGAAFGPFTVFVVDIRFGLKAYVPCVYNHFQFLNTGAHGPPGCDKCRSARRGPHSLAEFTSDRPALLRGFLQLVVEATSGEEADSRPPGARTPLLNVPASLFAHSTGTPQRAMGFEPTTSSLGSWHSTTELRPHTYITPI